MRGWLSIKVDGGVLYIMQILHDSAQLISVYQSLGRVSLPALYILRITGIIWQQLDLFLKQKVFLNRLQVCVHSSCCFAG